MFDTIGFCVMGGYRGSCRALANIINGDDIVTGTGWNVFVHPSARGAHKPGALLTKRGGRLPFLPAQLARPVGGRGLRSLPHAIDFLQAVDVKHRLKVTGLIPWDLSRPTAFGAVDGYITAVTSGCPEYHRIDAFLAVVVKTGQQFGILVEVQAKRAGDLSLQLLQRGRHVDHD